MKKERLNKFSVPLGLLDYINPIFYSITIITIIRNIYSIIGTPYNIILSIGAIISIVFGFIIPTGKVIVGLGIIEFRMPVSLVACVNTGILLSGSMILKYSINLEISSVITIFLIISLMLFITYKKSKKINTIAVLTGAFGYILIYISLIILSIKQGITVPIVLYSFAIILFIMLCTIGIKANLKNPKVHWIIEISNVICQFLVALGTILLFK